MLSIAKVSGRTVVLARLGSVTAMPRVGHFSFQAFQNLPFLRREVIVTLAISIRRLPSRRKCSRGHVHDRLVRVLAIGLVSPTD